MIRLSEKEAGKLKKGSRVTNENGDDDLEEEVADSLVDLLIKLWGLQTIEGTMLVSIDHPHRDVARYRASLVEGKTEMKFRSSS